MYQSLEDFVSDFISAVQDEHDSLWKQGDRLVEATTPEALARMNVTRKQVKAEAGTNTGKSPRTVEKRLQTSTVFPPELRLDAVAWEVHYLCACQDEPMYWLARAADMNLTVSQLKAEIAAAKGVVPKDEPEYLMKSSECRIVANADGSLTVYPVYPVDLAAGEVVQAALVTVTVYAAQVTSPTLADEAQQARDIGQRVVMGMLLGNDAMPARERLLNELAEAV